MRGIHSLPMLLKNIKTIKLLGRSFRFQRRGQTKARAATPRELLYYQWATKSYYLLWHFVPANNILLILILVIFWRLFLTSSRRQGPPKSGRSNYVIITQRPSKSRLHQNAKKNPCALHDAPICSCEMHNNIIIIQSFCSREQGLHGKNILDYD